MEGVGGEKKGVRRKEGSRRVKSPVKERWRWKLMEHTTGEKVEEGE